MPKYIIEREIPGAGNLSRSELVAIAQKSCDVIIGMKNEVQWLHSYVTGDKIYCVYYSPNEEKVKEHAQKGGFPADSIARISTLIEPVTAEG